MRRFLDDRWTVAILFLYALGVAVWPLATALPVTIEDGFYYFKVAQNIVQGKGSTFDGEHPTNGYHPLWLLCLLSVFTTTSTSAQALLLGKWVQAMMAAAAAGVLYRAARFLARRAAAAVVVLLWIELTHQLWLQGLELALHSLALAVTLHTYLRWFGGGPPRTAWPFLGLGLCCALTFLARLDAALLAAVLGVALLASGGWADLGWPKLRRLVAFAVPLVIAVLAYVATNLYLFGHVVPVSAAVKRAWSEALLLRQPLYLEHGWGIEKLWSAVRPLVVGWGAKLRPVTLSLVVLGLAAGAWPVLSWAARRRESARSWRATLRTLLPWVCYALASYLGYAVTYHRGLALTPRYYVIQPMIAALLLGMAGDRWAERLAARRTSMVLAAVTMVLVFLPVLTAWELTARVGAYRSGPGLPQQEAARWAVTHLPDDARVGSWNLGSLAYLSGRTVVNLDGLVNSWEFFEKDRHDLCAYWRKTGITYLVDVFRNGSRQEEVLPISPGPVEVGCPEALELLWRSERHDTAWSVRAYRVRQSR